MCLRYDIYRHIHYIECGYQVYLTYLEYCGYQTMDTGRVKHFKHFIRPDWICICLMTKDAVIGNDLHDLGLATIWCLVGVINLVLSRAVASLTVLGGQEFHFPHFSSNFDQFFLFFLKLYLFSSSFWPSGWAEGPGYATDTKLYVQFASIIVFINCQIHHDDSSSQSLKKVTPW